MPPALSSCALRCVWHGALLKRSGARRALRDSKRALRDSKERPGVVLIRATSTRRHSGGRDVSPEEVRRSDRHSHPHTAPGGTVTTVSEELPRRRRVPGAMTAGTTRAVGLANIV